MADLIDRQKAIDALKMDISIIPYAKAREYVQAAIETIYNRLEELPSVQPEQRSFSCSQENDMISRKAAIEALGKEGLITAMVIIDRMPSAQPEPLTDKEQRIFLAAMGREEKVCEEVDRNHVREPYEDSLMRVCKEIRRKVKGALWT